MFSALQAGENVHFVYNRSTWIEGLAKLPENKKIKKKVSNQLES